MEDHCEEGGGEEKRARPCKSLRPRFSTAACGDRTRTPAQWEHTEQLCALKLLNIFYNSPSLFFLSTYSFLKERFFVFEENASLRLGSRVLINSAFFARAISRRSLGDTAAGRPGELSPACRFQCRTFQWPPAAGFIKRGRSGIQGASLSFSNPRQGRKGSSLVWRGRGKFYVLVFDGQKNNNFYKGQGTDSVWGFGVGGLCRA